MRLVRLDLFAWTSTHLNGQAHIWILHFRPALLLRGVVSRITLLLIYFFKQVLCFCQVCGFYKSSAYIFIVITESDQPLYLWLVSFLPRDSDCLSHLSCLANLHTLHCNDCPIMVKWTSVLWLIAPVPDQWGHKVKEMKLFIKELWFRHLLRAYHQNDAFYADLILH